MCHNQERPESDPNGVKPLDTSLAEHCHDEETGDTLGNDETDLHSQIDQETTASVKKAKAHRTFLEVVFNDAQVSSPQTEQPDAQEKKAAHVAKLEAMIKMADSPETTEIHKSLTAELTRVTKTAKSQPNSVRLEKNVAWIA